MKTHYKSQRGSVLLVAMILTVAIAVAIGSYFSLTLSSLKMSNRSYHYSAAMNVAETGLEEGMWSINQLVGGTANAFTGSAYGWTVNSGNANQKFTGFTLGQNTDGYVNVFVKNYSGVGTAPTLVAKAVLSLTSGAPVEKWVEVELSKGSKFASGMVAKKSITFSGNNVTIDSWDSTPTSGTTTVGYSSSVAHDKGTVGSVMVNSTIAVQNADIWGFASVGGDSTSAITVGPNGLVGPYGTVAGVKDPTRVSTDFNAPLDLVPQPAAGTSLGTITKTSTLNQTNYTYSTTQGHTTTTTVGGTPTIPAATFDSAKPETWPTYTVSSIGLTNDTITVTGYVRLLITAAEGSSAIDIGGGSGALTISANSHLAIYTAGNIKIAGNGISNGSTSGSTYVNGLASALYIYGTGTVDGTQSIDVRGNGSLSAAVYAPNAAVSITGGGNGSSGDVYGSIVGSTVTMTGNTAFHYDEALGKDTSGSPYRVVQWRELITQSDRATWASNLAF